MLILIGFDNLGESLDRKQVFTKAAGDRGAGIIGFSVAQFANRRSKYAGTLAFTSALKRSPFRSTILHADDLRGSPSSLY